MYKCASHSQTNFFINLLCKRAFRKTTKPIANKIEFSEVVIKGKNDVVKLEKKGQFRVFGYTSPRQEYLPPNVNWTAVWPAAASFKSSVVPLPIRQGYIKNHTENEGVIPSSQSNLELMKIPNFLHLTPKHIKTHCDALKKFCTDWPSGLKDDTTLKQHYPIEVVTHDYVFSGNSIREPQARVVTLSIPLSVLNLDSHAQTKLLRLTNFNSQCQFDANQNTLIFTVDRCPLRHQNYEYIMYVLTVLCAESQKVEAWEFEQEESDWEHLNWEKCNSKASLYELLTFIKEKKLTPPPFMRDLPESFSEEEVETTQSVKNYREAASRLFDKENLDSLENYKTAVKQLLGLPVKM